MQKNVEKKKENPIQVKTPKNAVNNFGSCQLSELDYILKKQTELYGESGKELDLFAYFLGQCQKVGRKQAQR